MFSAKTATFARPALLYRSQVNKIHASSALNAKVAVVLSGCGVYDGTEVHEASAVLVHLSRSGAAVDMFAPNMDQMHVIDHTKGQPMEQKRNVLVESARIARDEICDLGTLKACDYDAVIFPGGFGAAKNLCSFAVDGASMKVHPQVEFVLKNFHEAKKPIGLCCIAPVLAAKVFPGCAVTMGSDELCREKWPYAEAAVAVSAMNSVHVNKDVTESHLDCKNNIITTPAFMCKTAIHNVFDGIGTMVKCILSLVSKS